VFVEWDTRSAAAGGTPRVWPLNGSAPSRDLPSAVGHRHLRGLLLVHDVLIGQGVATASQLLSQTEVADAIDACEYFDLHDLAATVAEIPLAGSSPLPARVFDAEYHHRYATMDYVVAAILKQIATGPDEFRHGVA
jgi:hypothetical protein